MKHFATVMLGFGIVLAALPPARAADTTTCPPPGSTVNGNLIVPPGQRCELAGVTVTGNVQVQPNAFLDLVLGAGSLASKIEGNLTLGSGTYVLVYGTGQESPAETARIGGNVTADHCEFLSLGTGSTAGQSPNPAVVVGGNVLIQYCQLGVETDNTEIGGNFTCNSFPEGCYLVASNIKGNVQSNNNVLSAIELNTVGGNMEVNNNEGAGIIDNTIGGNLQCQGNTSITGSGNMVGGHKTGQCTNF